MKIIKEGQFEPKNVKRFECAYCGCIFEAHENEYGSSLIGYTTDDYGATPIYYSTCGCPTCNSKVHCELVNIRGERAKNHPFDDWRGEDWG